MATTGFWPIKGNLKDAIKYAQNPDKTTKKNYLDEDLYNALKYVSNDAKTDKTMFVSTINCPKQLAYESMMATKQRFGKLGGNVAYHGYQSFKIEEITPEEAHNIGMATAKAMWGDEYEIVVTTHLNTENLHNHFVVNSVSFKTGRKFENHISDHYRLREISDSICREHNKSVLENSGFYGSNKKEYWIHKSGKLSHKDMLKKDLDLALSSSCNMEEFQWYLFSLGYVFERGLDHKYPSVTTADWKRPVRLERLGEKYSVDNITRQLKENYYNNEVEMYRQPPIKRTPMKQLRYEMFRQPKRATIDYLVLENIEALFALMIELIKVCTGANYEERSFYVPHSPEMRAEVRKMDAYMADYTFLHKYEIRTPTQLQNKKEELKTTIKDFEDYRQKLRNKIRRESNPEAVAELKNKCKEITEALKPVRKELKAAERIEERIPKVAQLMAREQEMEDGLTRNRTNKSREYER